MTSANSSVPVTNTAGNEAFNPQMYTPFSKEEIEDALKRGDKFVYGTPEEILSDISFEKTVRYGRQETDEEQYNRIKDEVVGLISIMDNLVHDNSKEGEYIAPITTADVRELIAADLHSKKTEVIDTMTKKVGDMFQSDYGNAVIVLRGIRACGSKEFGEDFESIVEDAIAVRVLSEIKRDSQGVELLAEASRDGVIRVGRYAEVASRAIEIQLRNTVGREIPLDKSLKEFRKVSDVIVHKVPDVVSVGLSRELLSDVNAKVTSDLEDIGNNPFSTLYGNNDREIAVSAAKYCAEVYSSLNAVNSEWWRIGIDGNNLFLKYIEDAVETELHGIYFVKDPGFEGVTRATKIINELQDIIDSAFGKKGVIRFYIPKLNILTELKRCVELPAVEKATGTSKNRSLTEEGIKNGLDQVERVLNHLKTNQSTFDYSSNQIIRMSESVTKVLGLVIVQAMQRGDPDYRTYLSIAQNRLDKLFNRNTEIERFVNSFLEPPLAFPVSRIHS